MCKTILISTSEGEQPEDRSQTPKVGIKLENSLLSCDRLPYEVQFYTQSIENGLMLIDADWLSDPP